MDCFASSEFVSVTEEKFDFDISLSPASSKGEEDDEVFLGPVHHRERCMSVGVDAVLVKDSVSSGPLLGEEPSWSPLAGEKFEEICKEAHLLASQLEGNQQQPDMGETICTLTESKEELKEDFVQDAGAKLGMLCKSANAVLSPIKRETFCVQDSPLKQLPPAIQKRLLRAGGVTNARVSTSSPVRGAQTQPMMALRGRTGLTCNGGMLPSKPAAPRATTTLATAKTRAAPAEKTTRLLPPPSKGKLGLRRSTASCNASRESSEDLLSDAASLASDISESVLNSSLHSKRRLAPPSKSGLWGPSTMKPPPPQTRRMTDRTRNTSSSSSSVSSFNSSLSVSPAGKGQLNASLNSSISGPSSCGLASVNQLANHGGGATKMRKSSLICRAPEPTAPRSSSTTTTTGGQQSISSRGKKPSGPERPKPVRVTPMKRPGPVLPSTSPLHQTPVKRAIERTSSVPNISAASSAKGNPKLKAFITPTPTSHLKGLGRLKVVTSPDSLLIMKPKKLMAFCSADSPQKPAAPLPVLLQTPSTGASKLVQLKTRRPSALPTPVNRRTSGIPTFTPKSGTWQGRPSLSTSTLPSSTRRASPRSPAQVKGSHQEVMEVVPGREPLCPAKLQPFPLVFSLEDEPEADPTTITTTYPQPETNESTSSVSMISQDSPEPSKEGQEHPEVNEENQEEIEELKELGNAEEFQELPQTNGITTQEVNEVLLVDAPAPILRPQEKLLIDLSNTPDLTRTASLKPSGGQLIDLSSPLIRWSPEDKKENALNDAPLINLSF